MRGFESSFSHYHQEILFWNITLLKIFTRESEDMVDELFDYFQQKITIQALKNSFLRNGYIY